MSGGLCQVIVIDTGKFSWLEEDASFTSSNLNGIGKYNLEILIQDQKLQDLKINTRMLRNS